MTIRQEKYIFSTLKRHEAFLERLIALFPLVKDVPAGTDDGSSNKPVGVAGELSNKRNPQTDFGAHDRIISCLGGSGPQFRGLTKRIVFAIFIIGLYCANRDSALSVRDDECLFCHFGGRRLG